LQKFLSDAGVASRRRAEELILEGRVLVNDAVVDELPAFLDPDVDRVIVDGVEVRPQRLEYFLVHKPKGVVCTNRDKEGRMRAVDLLPDLPVRLFPVGRLDAESTGLLLMTNDGELAERLTHPRYGVPKTYRAEVRGKVDRQLPATMKAGVYLAEGKASASEVEIVHAAHDRSVLMITLREGRNRQVRRMLARLGHPVKKLKRVQIGTLSIRRLPVGASRRLSTRELETLRREVEKTEEAAPRKRRQRKPRKRARKKAGAATTADTHGSPGRRAQEPDDESRPKRRLIT
jgi:23S rRNA pseudouridine2605 synthase